MKYLYHYTSVDTLKLIFKNNTLRFSNLTKLDDPLENLNFELDYSPYTFISCWADNDDIIHYWREYATLKGVCIGLPIYPFEYKKDFLANLDDNQYSNIKQEVVKQHSNLLDKDLFDKGLSLPPPYSTSLIDVEYKDFHNLMDIKNNQISQTRERYMTEEGYLKTESKINVKTDIFGKYKTDKWDYQNEKRYKILLNPYIQKEQFAHQKENMGTLDNFVSWYHSKLKSSIKLDYLDIKLDKTHLNYAKIALGPNISEKEKLGVCKLIKSYNQNAQIYDAMIQTNF